MSRLSVAAHGKAGRFEVSEASGSQRSSGIVFVSHEKHDQGLAQEIRRHLEAGGFACWMAPDDIAGPVPWPEQISNAIDTCAVMLVVVSAHANSSAHVSREVDLAVEKGKPLLPVRVADIAPTGSLDYLLRLAQWIDLFPGTVADHATNLQTTVASMLPQRDPTPPPPPTAPPSTPPATHRRRPPTSRRSLAVVAAIAVVAVIGITIALTREDNRTDIATDEPADQALPDEPAPDEPSATNEPTTSAAATEPTGGEGTVTRVSVSTGGSEGNDDSLNPDISADGRYVVFDSIATNLVESDTNDRRDVFIHDRETGETTRMSQVAYGDRIEEGNDASSHPSISGNGRFVVYLSSASNLDPDRSQATNLYLHDRETGHNRQIGFNEGGMEHPQEPIHADVSDDGTLIAYATYPGSQLPPEGVVATPMDERGTNYEVWVHDTTSGTTSKVVSFDLSVPGVAVTHGPRVTPDGAFVWANGGSTGGTFVFERATGTVTEVALGVEVDYLVPFPDGNRIAFTSGNALVADDVNGADDAYVHDRSTGQFRLLAEFGPEWGGRPSSISSDGRYLAIAAAGNAPRVIDTTDGGVATELSASFGLGALEISGDGQWAAFSTGAGLVDGDSNGKQDVFVILLEE